MKIVFLLTAVVAIRAYPSAPLVENHLIKAIRYASPFNGTNLQDRKFEVSYEQDSFLMDGKPFRYISGSVHYFRMPHQYWEDRLKKVRLLGFNAISTYVEWSLHEPSPGKYNFRGDADLVQFIQLAQKAGLYVIFRPGPYICAEREFGGLPPWLLKENPNMKFRTSDPTYEHYVKVWMEELFKRVTPLLYGNGGPIITVQVENEYGLYSEHDVRYLSWLRDLYSSHVQDKAVLFTTDPWYDSAIAGGKIANVLTTVDFGTSPDKIMDRFQPLRNNQPHGPLVNSEFYTGWISYWGNPMAHISTEDIVRNMKELVTNKVNFNCYMIFGGTNFGFSAGQDDSNNKPIIDLTSYDYEAPISEAGDLTDRYMAIWELLKSLGLDVGSKDEVDKLRYSLKGDYSFVSMSPVVSLLDSSIGKVHTSVDYPLTMEAFGQSYGFISYTHTVTEAPRDPSLFHANVRDRAIVFVDKEPVSILANGYNNKIALPPSVKVGSNITLLVENEGRRNFKKLDDVTKGMVSNATMDDKTLRDWEIVNYPLSSDDIEHIDSLPKVKECKYPAFFKAYFDLIPLGHLDNPFDTFLNMTGWGKGVVFINGHNIGRYWHIGPQMTLYVPGVWLYLFPRVNTITILELHYINENKNVHFADHPEFWTMRSVGASQVGE